MVVRESGRVTNFTTDVASRGTDLFCAAVRDIGVSVESNTSTKVAPLGEDQFFFASSKARLFRFILFCADGPVIGVAENTSSEHFD